MILYLHGFTSGPQSHKAVALGARMAERGFGDRFICPQLPAAPKDAVALTDAIVRAQVGAGGTGTVTVVGSSLGGYYATHLAETFGLRAVLVNPAVVAHIQLEKYLGPQRWLYTDEAFDFTRQHIDELRAIHHQTLTRPERYWLLAETGDETLDYRHAVARYAGARQTVLPGGDHSFTRWTDYLDDILTFAGFA